MRTNWFHILTALARDDLHGAAIADDVNEQTDGDLRLWPATLYRTLEEMAQAGLIEERTEGRHPPGESRKKRFFRATPQGRLELATEAERLSAHAARARSRLRGEAAG